MMGRCRAAAGARLCADEARRGSGGWARAGWHVRRRGVRAAAANSRQSRRVARLAAAKQPARLRRIHGRDARRRGMEDGERGEARRGATEHARGRAVSGKGA